MNTTQAKTETVFERVEASIARLGKEAAERDRRNVILVLSGIAVAVAVLGVIIRWPS